MENASRPAAAGTRGATIGRFDLQLIEYLVRMARDRNCASQAPFACVSLHDTITPPIGLIGNVGEGVLTTWGVSLADTKTVSPETEPVAM